MELDLDKLAANIPVMPAVAAKIMGIAADNLDISFKELENIIKMDQGLTARILKIANSAQYARQREITQLQSAITLMGFKTLKNLVLVVTASGMFSRLRNTGFYRQHWYHSLLTGFLAKNIALACKQRDIAEECFLAGLFHDIGSVILYSADRESYRGLLDRAAAGELLLQELEQQELGTDHRQVGRELLNRWNFPAVFVDAAAEHDSVNITSSQKRVIVLVTVANRIARESIQEAVPPESERILRTLLPHTCLTESDVQAYRENLYRKLSPDPLFGECMDMFGIEELAP